MAAIRPPSSDALDEAAAALRAGRLVAFPTETVYGLGADARSDAAVADLYAAKGRPSFNPLIVHVLDVRALEPLVVLDARARRLIDRFWPGPLTLVLPRRADSPVSLLACAGLDSLGVRSPSHPVARALLQAAAIPLVAPSANASGHVSPTEAAHVEADLGDRIDMILDGGPCEHGVESTIVGLLDRPTLLRPGAIARTEIESVLGESLAEAPNDEVRAPGQLVSHYAPSRPVRLDASHVDPDEALLAFGDPLPGAAVTINLSPTADMREAAARLFAALRELDRAPVRAIAVMPIPTEGLGEAIRDRLSRAAAPR
jgi:L-threonylcarbamoyladenylate synthase